MKKLSILLLAGLCSACVTGYHPDYFYNSIQIANLSGAAITAVNLEVGETGRTLACAAVSSNALCEERFGKRRYPQQAIQLSWTHADGSRHSQQMTPHIAAYFSAALSLQLMLEINPDASVKQYFKQEEPAGVFDL